VLNLFEGLQLRIPDLMKLPTMGRKAHAFSKLAISMDPSKEQHQNSRVKQSCQSKACWWLLLTLVALRTETCHEMWSGSQAKCFWEVCVGELVGFGLSMKPPFLHYFVLDADGRCTASFPIPLPGPVMMHDIAITQDYVIFLDFPLVFKLEVSCVSCSLVDVGK
jgi:Retinal pigment epithelial membrane protein